MKEPAKGKDFGLAAQLARPRPPANVTPKIAEEDPPRNQDEAPEGALILPASPAIPMEVSKTALKRPPGRPRRAEKTHRMTLVLSDEMSEYLNSAWRTHRRANGQYVNGPSAFIEELLRTHRLT
jgi:hypothetical protein